MAVPILADPTTLLQSLATLVLLWLLTWKLPQWILRRQRFIQHINALPGPPLKPPHFSAFYGHIHLVLKATVGAIPGQPKQPAPVLWFLDQIEHYKEEGLLRLWVFHPIWVPFLSRTGVFVLDSYLIQQILVGGGSSSLEDAGTPMIQKEPRIYRRIAKDLLGGSFLSLPDGPEWKRARKLTAPIFSGSFLELVHETVGRLLETHVFPVHDTKDKNDADPHSNCLEAMEWSARLTLDVLGLTAFSHSFGGLESFYAEREKEKPNNTKDITDNNHTEALFHSFTTILATFALRNLSPLPIRRYMFWTQENIQYRRALRRLNSTIETILQQRLKDDQNAHSQETSNTSNTNNDQKKKNKKDILSNLLQRDPQTGDYPMSYDAIVANVRMFLFAGHDTTAAVLAWALYELAQQPDLQDKLRTEIDGLSPSSLYKPIASLPYLDAVVRETLRLHAPGPVARVATRDFELQRQPPSETKQRKDDTNGGPTPQRDSNTYLIPKGTKLYMFPMYAQRLYARPSNACENRDGSTVVVDDRAQFRPERFLNQSSSSSNRDSWYMPFSVGPRNCVGQPMAICELKSILFHMLQRYIVHKAPADLQTKPPVHVTTLTVKPHAAWVRLEPRKRQSH